MKRKIKKIYKYYKSGYLTKVNIKTIFHLIRTIGLRATFYKIKYYISTRDLLSQNNIPSDYTKNDKKIYKDLFEYCGNSQNVFLLISHNLSLTGAPLLLLNIAKNLNYKHKKTIILITMMGGELENEFSRYCFIINLQQKQLSKIERPDFVEKMFESFSKLSIFSAIGNTVASALFIPFLEKNNFNYQILIHEMPELLYMFHWDKNAVIFIQNDLKSGEVVFSSEWVKKKYLQEFNIGVNSKVYQQGFFQKLDAFDKIEAGQTIRAELNLPADSLIILGAGRDFYRKGIDIFFSLSQNISKERPNYFFIFIGDKYDPANKKLLSKKYANFIFLHYVKDYTCYLKGADVFALTSRSDPLPNVFLDAMAFGLPVIAFDQTGGAPEVLRGIDINLVANYLDIDDYQHKLLTLLDNPELIKNIAIKEVQRIKEQYNFDTYITNLLMKYIFNLTVIVPNYNYACYLPERLSSIVNQTIKPFEILFLDDCSTDDSIEVADSILSSSNIPYKIIRNETNNGVYKQWAKGITLAKGDLIWIAEADDRNSPKFLESVLDSFNDKNVALAFSMSELIDSNGQVIQKDLMSHFINHNTLDWLNNWRLSGFSAIKDLFLYRNIIVNSSSAIFRKEFVDQKIVDKMIHFKFCGDWFFYISLLIKNQRSLYYCSTVLNSFRRHANTVTSQNRCGEKYLDEIIEIKKHIIDNLQITKYELDRSKDFLTKDYNFDPLSVTAKTNILFNHQNVYLPSKILIVSTNPSAQEGGGSEHLWIGLAEKLLNTHCNIGISILNKYILVDKMNALKKLGADISYFDENNCTISCSKFGLPDLVIISTGDHNEGASWFEACIKNNIPYFIINQLVKDFDWPSENVAYRIKHGYIKARKVFFTCKNNQFLMEKLIGASLANAEQHFNPVAGINRDTHLYWPDLNGEYHLACPGRFIVIHKGQDLLFEVMSQDKWKNRKLIINLYGNGPDEKELHNLGSYYGTINIKFREYQKDIKDIWKVNHGIIMPSRMEGVPIVLLGAMLCSRVPILTNVGGHNELVKDNESGFIATSPTVEAIDEALERAWQSRISWREMGAMAREAVLDFQPENPVEDFIKKINI